MFEKQPHCGRLHFFCYSIKLHDILLQYLQKSSGCLDLRLRNNGNTIIPTHIIINGFSSCIPSSHGFCSRSRYSKVNLESFTVIIINFIVVFVDHPDSINAFDYSYGSASQVMSDYATLLVQSKAIVNKLSVNIVLIICSQVYYCYVNFIAVFFDHFDFIVQC